MSVIKSINLFKIEIMQLNYFSSSDYYNTSAARPPPLPPPAVRPLTTRSWRTSWKTQWPCKAPLVTDTFPLSFSPKTCETQDYRSRFIYYIKLISNIIAKNENLKYWFLFWCKNLYFFSQKFSFISFCLRIVFFLHH